MTMLWMILFLILVCGFCNSQQSQEFNNSRNIINGTEGVTNCIEDYIDLEIYIINNKKLVEAFARTFFSTGKAASKFVKITYNFQTN